MNWQRAFAVTRKDIKEVLSTGQSIWPMAIVSLIFIGLMPTVIILSTRYGGASELTKMVEKFPPALIQQLTHFNDAQKVIYFSTVYLLAPLFLIIPMMVSTMISANSFAGEKERKTLEGILYTPVTDMELIFGKAMASLIPAIGISWAGFIIYSAVVNILAYPVFNRLFFPTLNWWIMILWLVPMLSFLVIGMVVIISARVRGYQEANSIAGAVVLPIILITFGQVSGVMYLSTPIVFLMGLILLIIDALLLRFIVSIFHRDRLIEYIK
ncbi:MAG: ABC transporter permease subunit [Actinomycetota bacterium]